MVFEGLKWSVAMKIIYHKMIINLLGLDGDVELCLNDDIPEVVKYFNETGEYNYSLDDTDNEDSRGLGDMRRKLTELMEYVGETQPDIFSLEWKVGFFLCAS